MRNIKLILQYDGTDFSGWQSQAQGERTVQDTMTAAVQKVTRSDSPVVASGRTDSGVHALALPVWFKTSSALDLHTLRRALNANLPPDVRVMEAEDVAEGFHPIRDARRKRYVYLIANTDVPSAFIRRYAWHLPLPLDTQAMAEAATYFKGSHDFAAFMAAGSDVTHTVREVFDSVCSMQEELCFLDFSLRGGFIRFEITGAGFLRHMVRIMAGTLVEVGKGMILPKEIPLVISDLARAAAGPTAPAHGLFLERVWF